MGAQLEVKNLTSGHELLVLTKIFRLQNSVTWLNLWGIPAASLCRKELIYSLGMPQEGLENVGENGVCNYFLSLVQSQPYDSS